MVRLSHVHIDVSDLDKSLEFYGKKLGLKTTKIMETMGVVSLGRTSLVLDRLSSEKLETFRREEKHATIAFNVPDVAKYYREIRKKGVKTIDKPTKRSWGAFNFYLKDLDGYMIEVEQQK